MDQVVQRMQETLTGTVSFLAHSLDPAVPAILAAHASVATAKLGSERTMAIGKEPVVLASNMALPQFDYVALGHVHKAQVLSERPPMAYSGSLERVDFGEEQDEKGFYVLELSPESQPGTRCTSLDFHTVAARRFLTIQAKIDATSPDPAASVLEALEKREAEFKDAIVRIEVSYPEQFEGQLREADIRRVLKDAQSVSITRNVEKQSRVRLGGETSEELSPLRALELYLDSLDPKKLSPERKKVLLEYGERLIHQREAEK